MTPLALIALATSLVTVASTPARLRPKFPPPERFAGEIDAFVCQDAESRPAPGGVVCTGSSSMVFWKDRIAADLAPLTVIPRGFGGSTMYDLWSCLDQVVLVHAPRAVLIYEGDNDIASGAAPEDVRDMFLAIAATIHRELPGTRIWVLAVKPSPSRWEMWPDMARTNELLREACAGDGRLRFVDVATPMLGADGTPQPELYLEDRLHLSDAGYDLWTDLVAPPLLAEEGRFEPAIER